MKKRFIISAYTENRIGILSRITIMFTRRGMNIDSLAVSESALEGISKFTISVIDEEDKVNKLCQQIERHVEVLKSFYNSEEELIFQEVALYKVPTKTIIQSNEVEQIVRRHNARFLEITDEFCAIEKTGHKHETQALFEELSQYGILQFIRSGECAITRSSVERLYEFLEDRDKVLEQLNN